MSLLERLERRFGRYVIPDVTLWLVAGQALFYLADTVPEGRRFLDRVLLLPSAVMEGEVWRLLFFPLTPPAISPIWAIIYFFAFYYFGSAVESIWGAFKYNAYLLVGFSLTAAAAFSAPQTYASSHFVQTSVFLAFAALLPDAIIRIYFILPIKAQYIAAFTWVLYGLQFYIGSFSTRLMIGAAVANFFLFVGPSAFAAFKQAKRKRDFRRKVESVKKAVRHECHVCGLTSDLAPRTQFRYCSKCAGGLCYCPDHINDHEHAVEEE